AIEDVLLLDGAGRESAVFAVETPMRMAIRVRARSEGRYPLTAAATPYRGDGLLVSKHVRGPFDIELGAGQCCVLLVDFCLLNLGNGRYVFSVALYRKLAAHDAERYDLLDRSYEFDVSGNAPFDNGIFRHPAVWSVAESVGSRATR